MNNVLKQIFLLLFLTISPFINTNAQTITNFNGNVTDKDFLVQLDSANVKGVDATNALELFNVYTENGFYDANVLVDAVQDATHLNLEYLLGQNFPNPFNPSTKFNFQAPTHGTYTLEVFDILGRSLFSNDYSLSSGGHQFSLSGIGASGIYFYRMTGADKSEVKKMVALDGGSGNVNVTHDTGNQYIMEKPMDDEIKIIASKEGYQPDSTTFSWNPGEGPYTTDFELQQITKPDTITFITHQNLLPTNTQGDNTVLDATGNLFNGTTNASGNFVTDFVFSMLRILQILQIEYTFPLLLQ